MDPKKMAEYTLTVKEAAEIVGVTPSRIRQLVLANRLTGIMRAGSWFFKPETIMNFQRPKLGRPRTKK